LALGCATLTLIGCGGGSGDKPPPSPLAAPSNFTVGLDTLQYFRWSATPGAIRYELYVDPDGKGPLAEVKVEDSDGVSGTGFSYSYHEPLGFTGYVYGNSILDQTERLNGSYRLRACDANGCGAFTAVKGLNVAHDLSYEFASGRAPLQFSVGSDSRPRLSKDGLTLVIADPGDSSATIFFRNDTTQPWQQQAVLRSGKANFGYNMALSADGNTLAVTSYEPTSSGPYASSGVVYLYQRSGSTWTQQAYLDANSAPQACPRRCSASLTNPLALSADGNLLAVSANITVPGDTHPSYAGAVFTYVRTGVTWAPQAYLESGGSNVSSMALSSDGNTLAMNEGKWAAPLTGTPFVRIFAQQGNGTWNQQARIPAGIVGLFDTSGVQQSAMELSSDGNTLAVLALNSPGQPTPALDLQPADLSCGSLAITAEWYIALYARNGSTWQRQTAIMRGLYTGWALASDGNALFYGNATFTRSNGTWACP